ncbi:MAG: DUF2752 domain-containing protein [archaeon]
MKITKIKRILLEHISFDSPRAVAINLTLILVLLAIIPTSAINNAPATCIFKTIILPAVFHECPSSGIFRDCECPGCGLTRSVSRLLHGDIAGSIDYSRMGIVVLLVMLYLTAINGAKAFKGSWDKDLGT